VRGSAGLRVGAVVMAVLAPETALFSEYCYRDSGRFT
jgi:hypothetical protein